MASIPFFRSEIIFCVKGISSVKSFRSRLRITITVFLMEARFHNLFQIKFVELIFT